MRQQKKPTLSHVFFAGLLFSLPPVLYAGCALFEDADGAVVAAE
jgi:hypothetical protein